MDHEKMSLAELRAEVKKVRTALYKPVSRSKKADLVAELARHKGVTSSSSTKSEASSVSTAPPEPEKAKPKKVKAEKAEKKEKKEEKPKKEKKEKVEKKEPETLSLKRKAKNEAEPPMPRKKAKKDE